MWNYVICSLMVTVATVAINYIPEVYTAGYWENPNLPLVYVDGRYRKDLKKNYPERLEFFYDRVISVSFKINRTNTPVLKGGGHIYPRQYVSKVTGVLIRDDTILTTSNPYREICQNSTIERMYLYLLISRNYLNTKKPSIKAYRHNYLANMVSKFVCGRPVVPWTPDDPVRIDMRHGMHRPTHDVMVFRFFPRAILYDPPPPEINSLEADVIEEHWNILHKTYAYPAGSMLTVIANKYDVIKHDLTFVSTAYIHDRHIKIDGYLEPCEVPYDDNIILSCIHWFPRSWGHHICVRNVHGYRGLGSGATLFLGRKLIGLGSFALFREKGSVLVFTDIRPYHSLIFKTCTKEDQVLGSGLMEPDSETTTTTLDDN